MSDDYLFDKSGAPDPEVEALEKALGGLRYEGDAPGLSQQRRHWRWLSAAAALLLAVGAIALVIASRGMESPTDEPMKLAPAPTGWRYTLTTAGEIPTRPSHEEGTLAVGEWLETRARSRAEVEVADIGRVWLEPSSRLQLVATGQDQHRVNLAVGKMKARVDAPPELFVTQTPAATAVDMGCEYTLEVDDEGNGELAVTLGRVELRRGEMRSVVPAEARCEARANQGLGTPHFDTASDPLKAALSRIDFQGAGTGALDDVLESSSKRDTLTLWHLLQRPDFDAAARDLVLTRIESFDELPVQLTREGLIEGDPVQLDDLFWALYWTW